jgi:1-acyl-sn-glycerol-3-phosphate acyltransferase
MTVPYRVPLINRTLRVFLKPAIQAVFRVLGRIKIYGVENIPYKQPYVAAMNHKSLFDPPFVLTLWPETIEAIGASEIWERPGQKQLVQMYYATPVHRGEYDRELFNRVLSMLASGYSLVMSPEGRRSHHEGMQRAKPGLSYILEQARVPVVPVGAYGTTDDFWQRAKRGERPELILRIGKPLTMPPVEGKGAERREARQRNVDWIMAHIAGLLPKVPEYRGYYMDTAIEQ